MQNIIKSVWVVILSCSPHFLFSTECGIEVRFLQGITHAVPGQIITAQAEIINRNCSEDTIFVGHLDLPPLWNAIPSNDILIHSRFGQAAIQTVSIQVPETAAPGEYPVDYKVWAQRNMNIMDRDNTYIVIGELKDKTDPINFEITSPSCLEANPGEVLFVSACVCNTHPTPFEGRLVIACPNGWSFTPCEAIELSLDPMESKVLIYAVKSPDSVLAGEHVITLNIEGCPNLQRSVVAIIKPNVNVIGRIERETRNYNLHQDIQVEVVYTNQGNIPLSVMLEAQTDPICRVDCISPQFEIPPFETVSIPIVLKPNNCKEISSQFLLIRLLNAETGEQLYQNPTTFQFIVPGSEINDRYVRIPAYFKTMVVGDHHDYVFAAEFAGQGMIDKDAQRYLDFFFRIPTHYRRVIYNIDERLFVGIQDPKWNLMLGDTMYSLSPLTQRYRYGRGASIERAWDNFSAGIHYTQNTISSHCNSQEICSYIEYNPQSNCSLALNYMNKSENNIPNTNILSLLADVEPVKNVFIECEVGKNFITSKRDTNAYRIEANAQFWKDSWFSLEKVYAGPEFFGYYNHQHLLTSSLDIPLHSKLRFNFNLSQLKQNFDCDNHHDGIIPRQHQYDANMSYRLNPYCTVSVNGMLLRAKDLGNFSQYDFRQEWVGGSFFFINRCFNVNGKLSFGQQRNYLTHHTSHFLQQYYIYISKEFSQNLLFSLFYDGGNTNYYDAGPWRNTYGGSMVYRTSYRQWFELFAQRVKQNDDLMDLSQVCLNFNHTFRNCHVLQGTIQYYYYRGHYPNNLLFLISYSVPFTVPICRNKAMGDLKGFVYNSKSNNPISGALVRCGQEQTHTDNFGNFAFYHIPRGSHSTKVETLPDNLIATATADSNICICGGSTTNIAISVIDSCTIKGQVIQYGYKDIFAFLNNGENNEIIPLEGMNYIKIAIEREESEEIYTVLTNKKGEFRFQKLRPGIWRIKLATHQIPPNHELNFSDVTVDIKPGESFNVDFDVKPISPQIFKLDS